MKKEILVSILIPCYNSYKTIEKSIQSCLQQKYKNIEIIIINDGSTDNTGKLLKNYSSNKIIRIYKQENKGISFTRNKLLSLAKGDYIFFLDSDDFLPNESLEILVNNSENGKLDIVVGRTMGYYYFDNKKISYPFFANWIAKKKGTQYDYVKSNMCLIWGSIFKKDFINSLNIKFDINLKYFEDISIATFIFLKSRSFKQIKDIVYFYNRKHNNKDNLSSFNTNEMKKLNDLYFALKNLLNLFEAEKLNLDKKTIRSINGCFFPILFSFGLMIKSLTKNILARSMLKEKIIFLIREYNYEINFSKTWWKFIIFLYFNNDFINYIKINKLKKVVYIKKIKNKSIYNGLQSINSLHWLQSDQYNKKIIYINNLNFIKKNKLEFKKNRIFFLFRINSKDNIENIYDYIFKNNIRILGFSLDIDVDLNYFFKFFPNIILLDFYLCNASEDDIKKFFLKNYNIKKNIHISLTLNRDMFHYVSNVDFKKDFLFVEKKYG